MLHIGFSKSRDFKITFPFPIKKVVKSIALLLDQNGQMLNKNSHFLKFVILKCKKKQL